MQIVKFLAHIVFDHPFGGSGVEMENFEIVKKENFLLYANDFAIAC